MYSPRLRSSSCVRLSVLTDVVQGLGLVLLTPRDPVVRLQQKEQQQATAAAKNGVNYDPSVSTQPGRYTCLCAFVSSHQTTHSTQIASQPSIQEIQTRTDYYLLYTSIYTDMSRGRRLQQQTDTTIGEQNHDQNIKYRNAPNKEGSAAGTRLIHQRVRDYFPLFL